MNHVRSGEIILLYFSYCYVHNIFYFSQVLEAIAGIKQEPKEKLAELFYQNTLDLFFPKKEWNTNKLTITFNAFTFIVCIYCFSCFLNANEFKNTRTFCIWISFAFVLF